MNHKSPLPTKKINELPVNEFYPIYYSRRLQTKFGPAILVYLRDNKERFKVFLPKRFNNMIPDDDSDSEDDEGDMPRPIGFLNYYEIAFIGKRKLTNGYEQYEIRFRKNDYPFDFRC